MLTLPWDGEKERPRRTYRWKTARPDGGIVNAWYCMPIGVVKEKIDDMKWCRCIHMGSPAAKHIHQTLVTEIIMLVLAIIVATAASEKFQISEI
jgi:hypothetical protein